MPNPAPRSPRVAEFIVRSFVGAAIASTMALAGCSDLFTVSPDPGDVFDGPMDGLTQAELAAFIRGDEEAPSSSRSLWARQQYRVHGDAQCYGRID
jgi:hypothetical protein